MKGYWDGTKVRVVVVIKGVARERWVTISKIAVPLKVGTAMAAEVVGVCVITGISDLVFNKSLCVRKVNECIDSVLNKQ